PIPGVVDGVVSHARAVVVADGCHEVVCPTITTRVDEQYHGAPRVDLILELLPGELVEGVVLRRGVEVGSHHLDVRNHRIGEITQPAPPIAVAAGTPRSPHEVGYRVVRVLVARWGLRAVK